MNMLIAVGSILAILFVILKSLIVIQRGGQGKNGSTVAVRAQVYGRVVVSKCSPLILYWN